MQQGLQELRLKAEQERTAQEIYVRGIEDRAHREVDRAGEEIKRMNDQVREAGNQLGPLRQRIEGTQAALSQALQYAAAQRSRGDTLKEQLVRIRSINPTYRMAVVGSQVAICAPTLINGDGLSMYDHCQHQPYPLIELHHFHNIRLSTYF